MLHVHAAQTSLFIKLQYKDDASLIKVERAERVALKPLFGDCRAEGFFRLFPRHKLPYARRKTGTDSADKLIE